MTINIGSLDESLLASIPIIPIWDIPTTPPNPRAANFVKLILSITILLIYKGFPGTGSPKLSPPGAAA